VAEMFANAMTDSYSRNVAVVVADVECY